MDEKITKTLKEAATSFAAIADSLLEDFTAGSSQICIEESEHSTWYISRQVFNINGVKSRWYFLTRESWQNGYSGWYPWYGWRFEPDAIIQNVKHNTLYVATPEQLEMAARITADLVRAIAVRNWADKAEGSVGLLKRIEKALRPT